MSMPPATGLLRYNDPKQVLPDGPQSLACCLIASRYMQRRLCEEITMTMRSSISLVDFRHSFHLPGSNEPLPSGRYEVLVEEELLEGLSFAAYKETAAYLMIYGKGHNSGPREMRPISSAYLNTALKRDAALDTTVEGSPVRLSDITISNDVGSAFQNMPAQQLQSRKAVTVGSKIKHWIQTAVSFLSR